MKILIEIGDKLYDLIKHYERSIEIIEEENDTLEITLMRAIINGTLLPKGHGRIIDADDIAIIDEQFYVPSDYYVAESAIDNTPTIIEAEKEE